MNESSDLRAELVDLHVLTASFNTGGTRRGAGWLNRCEAFDADPETWLADQRREAEVALQCERDRQQQQ